MRVVESPPKDVRSKCFCFTSFAMDRLQRGNSRVACVGSRDYSTMDLLRCEKCNSIITNFANHRCLYNEYSYRVTGFESPDSIFGNNPQGIPATTSHSAEGADFNFSASKFC
ncbi:hypothetical protein CDAR_531581 [Caerostris darwini]|uniref:Uncharacterized protein n=1 Tax=Caerostris darwini TaxID=1538125 RepID=A0AAV4WR93_9ARAC|nr:hypothetical protein CDAR_531581 [Caerostris darwini]